MRIAGGQIQGARDAQEDSYETVSLVAPEKSESQALLAVLADGVGGHGEGRLASRLVATSYRNQITKTYSGPNAAATIQQQLKGALKVSNETLARAIANAPELEGMGSTLVTVIVQDGLLWWLSVGDSHLYLVRGNEVKKLNALHTFGRFLEEQAKLGIEVADAGDERARKALTSAVCGTDIPHVDCPKEPAQLLPGDLVLLASDGLNALSPGRILYGVRDTASAAEAVNALLQAVQAAALAYQDNTTVIAISLEPQPVMFDIT